MCRIIPFAPSPDCIAPSDTRGSCPSRRNPGPPTALSSRMLREFNGLPQAYVGSTRLQRPVSDTLSLLVCLRREYFCWKRSRSLTRCDERHARAHPHHACPPRGAHLFAQNVSCAKRPHHIAQRRCRNRSEERRVGKECRSRWSPYH